MDYLQIDGARDEWFVLFHGTGGSEYSLLQIAGDIDPTASIIAFSGNVNTGAQRRFFAPLEHGQLNRLDFNTRIDDFLAMWPSIKPKDGRCTFIGYSNGANFILGLLEKQPTLADRVVLLHPSNLQYDFQAGSYAHVIVTTGASDTLSLAGDVVALVKQLETVFPQTTLKLLDGGHGTTDAEIDYIQHMLKS